MIGMNTESELIDTCERATLSRVFGAFQVEHFVIKTMCPFDELTIEMTDLRSNLKVKKQKHYLTITDATYPLIVLREMLLEMVSELENARGR
jgi:hypothetical protein